MHGIIGLLLAVHIVCMSVAATGPLIATWCEYREGRGDSLAGYVGRWLLVKSLQLFLIGAILGLFVGWLEWSGGLSSVLGRLSSKVFYGVFELIFSSVLMLVHWLWWRRAPNLSVSLRTVRASLGVLAGTNLLYHFPVLFAVARHLIHQGESLGDAITASDFRLYLIEPAVSSRVVHVVLASFVAGGLALIASVNLFSLHRFARGDDGDPQGKSSDPTSENLERDRRQVTAWGARLAMLAATAQLPSGLWVFAQLSAVGQQRLLGGDLAAGIFMALGIASALWMLHLLASLCLGEDNLWLSRRVIVAFLLTMILMTMSSRRVMAGEISLQQTEEISMRTPSLVDGHGQGDVTGHER